MKKLPLSRRTFTKTLAILSVFFLVLFAVHFVPRVFATNDFTTSNLTFDPATGFIAFDYTGTDLTGSDIAIEDTTETTTYWASSTGTFHCTSSHCYSGLHTVSSDTGVSTVILDTGGYKSQDLSYPFPLPTAYTSQNPSGGGGWLPAGETWTYTSADSPTYAFTVSGDDTGKYSPGMRIKLTQTSSKYFIITAVSYSSPNTTVTVYGGTDYTLANSTISNPYYSEVKAPQGFPLDSSKWTVKTDTSTGNNQGFLSNNTWYNIGGVSLSVPIGAWRISYETFFGWESPTAGNFDAQVTLSASSSSQDDADMTSGAFIWNNTGAGSMASKEKYISLTGKTTYYLLIKTTTIGGIGSLDLGSSAAEPIIQATSAYL